MIELIVMLLASLNGTDDNDDDDDNSTISGCDYYGGANLRLDCEEEYCPRDYYGGPETGLYDLLDRWCQPDNSRR